MTKGLLTPRQLPHFRGSALTFITYLQLVATFSIQTNAPQNISPASGSTGNIKMSSNIQPLGPSFARGWRALSDELRLKIFEFILVLERELRKDYSPLKWGEPWSQDLVALLACSEVSQLARETFYSRNTFLVDAWARPTVNDAFQQIPFRHGQHLRRLHIRQQPMDETWLLIRTLAQCLSCFPVLQKVKLSLPIAWLSGWYTISRLCDFMQRNPVMLDVKSLKVTFDHDDWAVARSLTKQFYGSLTVDPEGSTSPTWTASKTWKTRDGKIVRSWAIFYKK
ncbi:hypothetical protein BDV96DRAFT_675776 [Lophiotrema nucula]|uniref:Uncharacterized protein n=1 Tax=Lophiotrema nucula TaxID=690887 RepID=A0A6A5YGS2_9PLEO|nr:hypothetical protein BDV96DRAFT_675776 [Lophiotrema nucula]